MCTLSRLSQHIAQDVIRLTSILNLTLVSKQKLVWTGVIKKPELKLHISTTGDAQSDTFSMPK